MGNIIRLNNIKHYTGLEADRPDTLPYGDTYLASDSKKIFKYGEGGLATEVGRDDTPKKISTLVGGTKGDLANASRATSGMGYASSASISADGSKLIVGNIKADPLIESNDNKGSMTTYAWNGSTWIFVCRTYYTEEWDDSYFGISCALNADGTVMVVGADYHRVTGFPQCGGVFTYDWNDTTNSWDYRNTLISPGFSGDTGPQYQARFGIGVDIDDDGTRLVVGEYYRDYATADYGSAYFQRDYEEAGAAHYFELSGGVWVGEQSFLCEPSIMDEVVYHTTKQYWVNGLDSTTSNYFKDSTTNFPADKQQYALPDGIMSNFASMQPRFGASVAISGDGTKIIIGMSGYGEGTIPLDASSPTEEEYFKNIDKTQLGAAFYYQLNGDSFEYKQTIKAPDGSFNDWFAGGLGISNDGNVLGIGAWTWEEGDGLESFKRLFEGDPISDPTGIYTSYNKTRGESTGQVYLFDYNEVTNQFDIKIQFGNEEPTYFNRFGRYVALDKRGDKMIVTEHKNIAISASAVREGKVHTYTNNGSLNNYYDQFNSRGFYNKDRSLYLNDNYGTIMHSVEPSNDPQDSVLAVGDRNLSFDIPMVANERVILSALQLSSSYADDVAAAVGGVQVGELYRNGSSVNIRIS